MRLHPAAGRRVLVVAPHPDDEAIGAWGLMRVALREGAQVRIVVVSDGGASHPGSRRWPRQRLVAERRRETLRAAASLGLGRASVHFCGLADGGLGEHISTLRQTLGRVVRRARPTLIVGPVTHDAHADHRAVALALQAMPARGARRIGYQVWPEQRHRRGAVHVALDGPALAQKRRVVRGYRTQMGLIDDAQAGFAMTSRHLRAFVRPFERFEVLR